MTIADIIQRIQSLYSKGVESDDTRLMSRHIYNKLLTVRSRLISQEAKKKQKISQWNYQVLPCIELIVVPAHECPCVPPIGCDILRSRHKIPEPLSGLSGSLIQTVTTIDRSKKINEISLNAVNSKGGNKYTSQSENFFVENGYLYITAPKTSKLSVIRMVALFEDPIDARKFPSFCEEDCVECADCTDYQEEDFPIDNDLIDAMVELTINELVLLFGQAVQDIKNSSSEDATKTK